jgi:hypothetical protein
MSSWPILKQAADLVREDFEAHPVWVHCHVMDYDEPWYGETDEETFRPWLGEVPVDPSQAIFLIRAEVVFRDGSRHPGFVSPAEAPDDIGTMQPSVFMGDRWFRFWGGMPGIPTETRQEFYRAAGRTPDSIFPARASAHSSLSKGRSTIIVHGFYRWINGVVACER